MTPLSIRWGWTAPLVEATVAGAAEGTGAVAGATASVETTPGEAVVVVAAGTLDGN